MNSFLKKLNPFAIWSNRNYHVYSLLHRVVEFSHPFLSIFEKSSINKYALLGQKFEPIFIVGAPRTGSTFVYQVLSNRFNLLYMDNLAALFRKNLYLGFWFSSKFFGERPHNCFTSVYGNTLHEGYRAPSEGKGPWKEWSLKETAHENEKKVSTEKLKMVGKTILAIMNLYGKPLLFKNLKAGQQIRFILQFAPNAKFILVKRDPFYTAQSIYLGKRKRGMSEHKLFGTYPRNFGKLASLREPEQIVKQIFHINKQVLNDATLLDEGHFITIDYEDLCLNYEKCLREFHEFIGKTVRLRASPMAPSIVLSKKVSIPHEVAEKIKAEIAKLDWEHYKCEPC